MGEYPTFYITKGSLTHDRYEFAKKYLHAWYILARRISANRERSSFGRRIQWVVPVVEILEFRQQSMRNDDAARGEDARLIVRVLDAPLDRQESFAEFLQLLQQFRRFVRVARILPAALDRLGAGHPRRKILQRLLEDTYFLQRKSYEYL